MKLPLFTRSLATVVAGAVVVFAAPAAAQEGAAEKPEAPSVPSSAAALDARIAQELAIGNGLTSDAAARAALATSFDVRARRSEVLAAAAAVDEAAAAYLPRLTASARYTRVSDESGGSAGTLVAAPGAGPGPIPPGTPLVNVPLEFKSVLNQYNFQASLAVPLSDYLLRIGPGHTAAEYGEKAAKLSEQAARRKAQNEARLAYYGWVGARLDAIVAEQAVLQARAHLEDVNRAEQAGKATRADILAVEAQLAQGELFAERSQSLARVTEERLRTMLHERAPREFRIGEDVLADLSENLGGSRIESLWAEARRSRPELRAFAARSAALAERADIERAAYYPRLEAFGNAYYSNPNMRAIPQRDEFRSSWDAGLQLTFTFSDIPRTSAAARGVEAQRAALLADHAALEDAVRMEIAEAREAVREAAAVGRASARRLVAAEEAYRVRRTLFQYGRATSVELTDAETELTRARLDAIQAKVESRVARVRLLHAVGRG